MERIGECERGRKKRTLLGMALLVLCFLCLSQTALAAGKVVKTTKITKTILKQLRLKKVDHLMIVAHPDDESLWGGAHLLKDNYLVVCLTNGDNAVRREEFKKALSITEDKGIILCYPDLVWKNGRRVKDDWSSYQKRISQDLKTLLSYKDWKVIATHNEKGEYGHIHHRLTHRLVKKAVRKQRKLGRLYYFGKYYTTAQLSSGKKPKKLKENMRVKKDKLCAVYRSQPGAFKAFGQMIPYENWTRAR